MLFVKRIIGLPGERVRIEAGIVHVDERPLDEPYVVHRAAWVMSEKKLGEREYFVAGDNRGMRSNSTSSEPSTGTGSSGGCSGEAHEGGECRLDPARVFAVVRRVARLEDPLPKRRAAHPGAARRDRRYRKRPVGGWSGRSWRMRRASRRSSPRTSRSIPARRIRPWARRDRRCGGRRRPGGGGFELSFVDVQVAVGDGGDTATAHLTLTLTWTNVQTGAPTMDAREVELALRKEAGEWRVAGATPVETLERPSP